MLRRELPARTPLIGFSGAPFTLYCYLVEGKGSKGFFAAKSFLYAEPAAADELLDKLATQTIAYLRGQAEAGAQALMIFDSWVGPPRPRRLRPLRAAAGEADPRGPRAARRAADLFSEPGGDAARPTARPAARRRRHRLAPAAVARPRILGPRIGVQGNLDPAALMAPPAELLRLADRVLDEAGPAPGHIFNLGHGIEPSVDPDQVARLVDHVHARTSKGGPA